MRAFELTVEDFPGRKTGRPYRAIVRRVTKSKSPPGLRVILEDLDPEQYGRQFSALLPVPVRPAGPTAAFFKACGLTVVVGQRINPRASVGVEIQVWFETLSTGEFVAVAFAPLPKEASHDR